MMIDVLPLLLIDAHLLDVFGFLIIKETPNPLFKILAFAILHQCPFGLEVILPFLAQVLMNKLENCIIIPKRLRQIILTQLLWNQHFLATF